MSLCSELCSPKSLIIDGFIAVINVTVILITAIKLSIMSNFGEQSCQTSDIGVIKVPTDFFYLCYFTR